MCPMLPIDRSDINGSDGPGLTEREPARAAGDSAGGAGLRGRRRRASCRRPAQLGIDQREDFPGRAAPQRRPAARRLRRPGGRRPSPGRDRRKQSAISAGCLGPRSEYQRATPLHISSSASRVMRASPKLNSPLRVPRSSVSAQSRSYPSRSCMTLVNAASDSARSSSSATSDRWASRVWKPTCARTRAASCAAGPSAPSRAAHATLVSSVMLSTMNATSSSSLLPM